MNLKIKLKVIETGHIFYPSLIDFFNRKVVEDHSMEDLTGIVGEYQFDEVEIVEIQE